MSTKSNGSINRTVLRDATLNLRTEVTHEALDRPCSRISQSTDGTTFDLFPERKKKKISAPTSFGGNFGHVRQFKKHVDLA
jgi:hypothetical protein